MNFEQLCSRALEILTNVEKMLEECRIAHESEIDGL